eukprot:CAMPEP_0115884062 /NCGR_PEP_ID=MMETSP0287-20121206/29916_1 /TAXON_ID=412157 /ORGANISM="Chrysochromulina rotalis, Strain UIO044" /LENGTH=33 /DNA_ID= /DNA_START= /DNA_END= /DNA_ORIENTATION=
MPLRKLHAFAFDRTHCAKTRAPQGSPTLSPWLL